MEDKKKFDEKLIIDKNHVVGFAPTFLELFAQRAMFKVFFVKINFLWLFNIYFDPQVYFVPQVYLILCICNVSHQGHENANAENGPWILTLEDCYYAENRSLHEEMFCAYNTCASAGVWDNTKIIDDILKLRLEKAKLLNYKNYAEVCFIYLF